MKNFQEICQKNIKIAAWMEPKFSRLPGLNPLDPADLLFSDDVFAKQMAYRDYLISSNRDVVFRSLVGSEVACEELLDVMVNNDSPKADTMLMMESLQGEIERSLSTLTERERDVIRLFFGIGLPHGLTLEEIGTKFDLTRERVRQIKEKAIRRLRHTSRSKLLKTYLG